MFPIIDRIGWRVAALACVFGLVALVGVVDRSAPSTSDVHIEFAGHRQVVFDWSKQACTPTSVPDLPARAFRDNHGRIQLLLSDFDNFRLIGSSLNRLNLDCTPVMTSANDPDPAAYRDRQWIASLYTEDGRHIWALIHNEYQGNRHPGRCPGGTYFRCWYNAITLAESTDSGRSYSQRPAPRNLVAAAPYRYRPGIGPTGVFGPSNIVKRQDGYLYALVRVRDPSRLNGVCLIRSNRVGNAGSWRAWDGSSFDGVFTDPYLSPARPQSDCELLAPGDIAEMTESLTFNTVLRRYLLVGMAPAPDGAGGGTGIYYSTSEDLTHWSRRSLLLRAPTVHSFRCGGTAPIAYPSLVDPSSNSPTFATSGKRPYLYFTQFRYRGCRKGPDRDLMRIRVEISATTPDV